MGLNAGARKYTTAEWFDEWMKLYNIGRLKTRLLMVMLMDLNELQIILAR